MQQVNIIAYELYQTRARERQSRSRSVMATTR